MKTELRFFNPHLAECLVSTVPGKALFKFPNGFGASVIRNAWSYGGSNGLFELAVLRWEGENFSIDYTTPITDDVLGYLTTDQVIDVLNTIYHL